MTTIALIEDELPISHYHTEILQAAGFEVVPFLTKEDALNGLFEADFDAWILDLKLGGEETAGINLIGVAKERGSKVPILVVSGLEPTRYRSITTALGVWDFVSKPVEPEVLVFKTNQIVNASKLNDVLNTSLVPDLELDKKNPGKVIWKNNKVSLPLTAYKILVRLIEKPGCTVPYSSLYECVSSGATIANIRQHISVLRGQMSEKDPDFDKIQVTTASGYLWKI